jgi:hypothetical protein
MKTLKFSEIEQIVRSGYNFKGNSPSPSELVLLSLHKRKAVIFNKILFLLKERKQRFKVVIFLFV